MSERYSDLAERLGISTSLHKLRHYSATELIAAGVDVRTVAGRLGHGGGGTTTLRVYAAWVSESDQRAAGSLFARMPARPEERPARPPKADRPPHPYEAIAGTLREAIECGALLEGAFRPSLKRLAEAHVVAIGTAHRAVSLLVESGHVQVVPGRGVRVLTAEPLGSADADTETPCPVPAVAMVAGTRVTETAVLLDFVVRRRGAEVARFSACADPGNAEDLREVLVEAVLRRGEDAEFLADYELELRRAGEQQLIRTFVASRSRRRT